MAEDQCSVLKLRTPCGIVVSGSSGSGKSTFIKKVFKHMKCLFDTEFASILWCYGEETAIPTDLETHGIPFRTYSGVPKEWNLIDLGISSPALVVMEDLIEQAYDSQSVAELFTKKIHHLNLTCIFTTQNFFYQSKFSRTISLNASYIILMRNVRDQSQFAHLARQIEPHHSRQLVKAYNEAIQEKFSYFLIDLHPQSEDALRYRTCIFPTDFPQTPCAFWTTRERLDHLKNDGEQKIDFASAHD